MISVDTVWLSCRKRNPKPWVWWNFKFIFANVWNKDSSYSYSIQCLCSRLLIPGFKSLISELRRPKASLAFMGKAEKPLEEAWSVETLPTPLIRLLKFGILGSMYLLSPVSKGWPIGTRSPGFRSLASGGGRVYQTPHLLHRSCFFKRLLWLSNGTLERQSSL